MNLFIIEHPTKGVVTDVPGDRDDKYHYSWSKLRNDDSTRTFSLRDARYHVVRCAPGSEIRRWGGEWEVVA